MKRELLLMRAGPGAGSSWTAMRMGIVLAVILSGRGAFGQATNWFPQAPGGAQLGVSLSPVGDLDGDGVEDLAIGAPWPARPDVPGYVVVVSGSTGAQILRIESDRSDDQFGTAVCGPGDLDGDGVPDIVVGAWGSVVGDVHANPSRIAAFSGATGSVLWQLELPSATRVTRRLGWRMAALGDVNGDGIGDLLVSCESPWRVLVLDGSDGTVLRESSGSGGMDHGYGLCSVPDLDGDGITDYAVSEPAGPEGGRVRIFSGATGQEIGSIGGPARNAGYFGLVLACGGDMNGDGWPEIAVGWESRRAGHGSGTLSSALALFSLKDFTEVARLQGEEGFGVDYVAAFVPDRIGNGHSRIVCGSPSGDKLRLVSWNGSSFEVLTEFIGEPQTLFGMSAALLDGPEPALAVGAPWSRLPGSSTPAGAVQVYELNGSLRFSVTGER